MTPVMRRIIAALEEHGDMDAHDLAVAACCGYETLRGGGYLRHLLKAELIRISGYRRAIRTGAPTPIYSTSPGRNAPPPRPYSAAEKCRRWRKRTGYHSAAWYARKRLDQLIKGSAAPTAGRAAGSGQHHSSTTNQEETWTSQKI